MGFPLFTQALRFFNHSDQMVRSSVRYILLSLVCIKDNMLQGFLTEFFLLYHAHDIEASILNSWRELDLCLDIEELSSLSPDQVIFIHKSLTNATSTDVALP